MKRHSPRLSPPSERSALMRRVRTTNTTPEVVVRKLLRGQGIRFSARPVKLPGSPDIVLPRKKAVVFVHGCFWHGCTRCDRGTRRPRTNPEFWNEKIRQNRRRDRRVAKELRNAGWRVFTVWECHTRASSVIKTRIARLVSQLVER